MLILHGLGVWWTKRDAFWFQVLRRHLREKPYYEA
jgi:type IV secretory pathway TrbD component